MKLMIKTDRCAELLKEIQGGLYLSYFEFKGNNELANIIKEAENKGEAIRRYIKDKSGKDIYSTDEAAIRSVFDKDAVLRHLAFLKALIFYVLSPVAKLTNKDEQLNFTKSCVGQDPYADVIVSTVKSSGEPIYVKDLEDEFMEVCPDVNNIGKYLPLALSKYDEVKLPCRKRRYSMNDLVFSDNEYSCNIRKAESIGLITKEEAETILVSIWQIINRVNTVADWIMEMYAKIESLKPSNGSNDAIVQTVQNSSNGHFDVDLSYIEKIYNYIVNDAIPDTITNTMFSNYVSAADFSTIWKITEVKKAKLRYTIFILSKKMSNEWYKQAANSIGLTPQKCSGATVPEGWDNDIEHIK